MHQSLSVIVIGKNEERFLERCFISIKELIISSSISDAEVIYVDSQSTDNSITIAKKYSNKVFELTGDCSASAARKIGSQEARFEWLLFLDGDMEVSPNFYNDSFGKSNNRENISAVIGKRFELIWDSKTDTLKRSNENYYGITEERIANHIGGALLIQAKTLLFVGGYDEKMKVWEEPELLIRLMDNNVNVVEKPIPFIRHNNYKRDTFTGRLKRLLSFNPVGQSFGYMTSKCLKNGLFGYTKVFYRELLVWLALLLSIVLSFFDFSLGFLSFAFVNVLLGVLIGKRLMISYILFYQLFVYVFKSKTDFNLTYKQRF